MNPKNIVKINVSRLFYVVLKEYIRKPSCVFIILLIPIITIFINLQNDSISSSPITVGYYINDTDAYMMEEINDCLLDYDGIYKFISYNSLRAMQKDVLNNKLECAYKFSDDFVSDMLNGDNENSITVFTSSKTTLDVIINETIYAEIFPILSELKLENYIIKKSAAKDLYDMGLFSKKDISTSYNKYFTNGSTFHVDYDGAPEDFQLEKSSILLSPLKGLIAILILLSSLIGAYSYFGEDAALIKNNIAVRIMYILVPTLLSFISAILTIAASNNKITSKGIIVVIGILLLYSMICVCLSLLLSLIIKNQIIYASLIPIIVLGSIVFTPFIIDFSTFIPIIKYVSYIFPPYYLIMLL